MDNAIIEKIKNYSSIVKEKYPIVQVILYGSYARNEENELSDIDVAVVFDKISTDYIKITSDIYRLAVDIDERIETVVIEKGIDKSGFLDSILSYGKVIYKN
jgi:predicted nucleotidyltransferase